MTSVAAPLASDLAPAGHPRAGLRRLFKLALRDLRGNLHGFWVFLACLALGVAAIASVGTIADAVRGGLDAQGRVLLGGDLAMSRMHVRASGEERQLARRARQRLGDRLAARHGPQARRLRARQRARRDQGGGCGLSPDRHAHDGDGRGCAAPPR